MAEMLKIVTTDSVAMAVNDPKKVSIDDPVLIYLDVDNTTLYIDTYAFRNVSKDKLEKYSEVIEKLKPNYRLAFSPTLVEYLNKSFIFSEMDVFDLMDTLREIARDDLKEDIVGIKYILINTYLKMNEDDGASETTKDEVKTNNDIVKEANDIVEGELDLVSMLQSGIIKPDEDLVSVYKKSIKGIRGVTPLEICVITYNDLIMYMHDRDKDTVRGRKLTLLSLILEELEKIDNLQE